MVKEKVIFLPKCPLPHEKRYKTLINFKNWKRTLVKNEIEKRHTMSLLWLIFYNKVKGRKKRVFHENTT